MGLDPAYASNAMRREHRADLVARIAEVLKYRKRDEWLDIFVKARIPAGPIYRLDEVASDQALRDRGFLYGFERNGVRVPQVGLGIHFNGQSEGCSKPPPKLGEDNKTVYQGWLGLSEAEIGRLQSEKII